MGKLTCSLCVVALSCNSYLAAATLLVYIANNGGDEVSNSADKTGVESVDLKDIKSDNNSRK